MVHAPAEGRDGFVTLFTHKLVLPGLADLTTLKAVSALAGEVELAVRSISVTHGFRQSQRSTTWSPRRQPRLPVDAVAHGAAGTALLKAGAWLSQVWLPPLPEDEQRSTQARSNEHSCPTREHRGGRRANYYAPPCSGWSRGQLWPTVRARRI